MQTKKKSKAGRKPSKDSMGGTLTIRLEKDLFDALKKKANKRSVSSVARDYIKIAIGSDHRTVSPNATDASIGLAALILKIVEEVEAFTSKSWRKDRFTSLALAEAIDSILYLMVPSGEAIAPEVMRKCFLGFMDFLEDTKDSKETKALFKTRENAEHLLLSPHYHGKTIAEEVYKKLVSYKKQAIVPDRGKDSDCHEEDYYFYSDTRKKLGLKLKE